MKNLEKNCSVNEYTDNGSVIKQFPKNQCITFQKSNLNCPICDGILYTVDNQMIYVMDGNTIYQCELTQEHKYWNHPFEDRNILHLNRNATETDWTSEQDYKLIDGHWQIIESLD